MKIVLWILSKVYGFFATFRRFLYENGLISQKKLPVPVISIGNLSVGGTGKTPVTIYTAKILQKEGFKVCVLSRGYKRKSEKLIVTDTPQNVSYEEVGDEPYIILRHNIPVAVHKDRYKAGLEALKKLNPDIFILDDGFQHYQLYRDTDVLVIDATKPFWKDNLLPLGRLREPPGFYIYSDCFVVTRLTLLEETQKEKFFEKITEFKKPVFKTTEKIKKLIDTSAKQYPLEILTGKEVIVFSGLGNNQQFFKTVQTLSRKYNFKIKRFIDFPDHYDYKDFNPEEENIYLTTEKDIIKIKNKNVFALVYEIEIEDNYLQFLLKKIKRGKNGK